MLIVNVKDIPEFAWSSPNGRYHGTGKQLSEALGREPHSLDLGKRHPFDVEITRLAAGSVPFPFHAHSAQWEFYHVLSGHGRVRDDGGMTAIGSGDTFLFKPGEAHQLFSDGPGDLIIVVVADNPIGEAHYYPDSNKWGVPIPDRRVIRSDALDYYDGEE
jgi:uncharacterized cupin superfamily protein